MIHNHTTSTCDCCEGTEAVTPLATANRPGLDALRYRVGTYGSFLETMQARLSTLCLGTPDECLAEEGAFPLRSLTTRAADDPAIAMLHAWATVGDVLTFYQERIANEGYLRTATERLSILELARLVGYRLRPGISASVYLAFVLQDGYEVEIPAGTRAQSLPAPGELPQPFETAEPLLARAEWNAIRPRLTQPQKVVFDSTAASPYDVNHISWVDFTGTDTKLQANNPLLFLFGDSIYPWELTAVARRVIEVEPVRAENRTRATLHMKTNTFAVVARAREIIARFREVEAFGVSPERSMTGRVLRHLDILEAELDPQKPGAQLEVLLDERLAGLVEEHREAEEGGFSILEPWVGGLVDELREVRGGLSVSGRRVRREPETGIAAGNGRAASNVVLPPALQALEGHLGSLVQPPSLPPANAWRRARSVAQSLSASGDIAPKLLINLSPKLKRHTYAFWSGVSTPAQAFDHPRAVLAMRVKAAPFGHNAPLMPEDDDDDVITSQLDLTEWPLEDVTDGEIYLDTTYESIVPGSWVIIERADTGVRVARSVFDVQTVSLAAYGLTGKVTKLILVDGDPWLTDDDTDLSALRNTTVYGASEALEMAETPVEEVMDPSDPSETCQWEPVLHRDMDTIQRFLKPVRGDTIVLNGLYDGLEEGRWVIVEGERIDLPGVVDTELLMLASVEQVLDPTLPGDTTHTQIVLSKPLSYCYRRDSVTIYANVAKATHGETREEVLGSGDGSQAWQAYALKHAPLTFLAAPTPEGAASTLAVRVNDVLWHEADNLFIPDADDRVYVLHTDDDDATSVRFGDGRHGARLPTGDENVRAVYRSGTGKLGNVPTDKISMLITRPLGVKGVNNPLPATGGADRESRDQARENAPMGVMALDRLVSVQDYADFARTFAGIGKASAARLTDGRRQLVHVTIAGADDIPIAKTSDLYRSLVQALQDYGDPYQPLRVELRDLKLLVVAARVQVHPDYQWETVGPWVQAALLDAFSFARRSLGQDVRSSEVLSVIQAVPGVNYVDLDVLDAIAESEVTADLAGLVQKLEQIVAQAQAGRGRARPRVVAEMDRIDAGGNVLPAQLAYLNPDVPETLILEAIS